MVVRPLDIRSLEVRHLDVRPQMLRKREVITFQITKSPLRDLPASMKMPSHAKA